MAVVTFNFMNTKEQKPIFPTSSYLNKTRRVDFI